VRIFRTRYQDRSHACSLARNLVTASGAFAFEIRIGAPARRVIDTSTVCGASRATLRPARCSRTRVEDFPRSPKPERVSWYPCCPPRCRTPRPVPDGARAPTRGRGRFARAPESSCDNDICRRERGTAA
jgi:hypothetical protein